jgi:putative DNA primase/helicase
MTLCIPDTMPQDRLQAALLYRSLDLPVYPCNGPREGTVKERGKKPRVSGWQQWAPGDLTDQIAGANFGPAASKPANIGMRVVSPLVIVDLDSKIDSGATVREWLASKSELAAVPYERTGNGAHLWLICPDLPAFTRPCGKLLEKPLMHHISGRMHAELNFAGNIIVSPSVHPDGLVYTWEKTGEVPAVSWAQLQEWFGFTDPNAESGDEESKGGKGGRKKSEKWWLRFRGDIASLEIVSLMREVGGYGQLIEADEVKHSIRCPWCTEHSDGGKDWSPKCSETVVFEGRSGKWPGFVCLHAHCTGRGLRDLLAWAEARQPGVVDRSCLQQRGIFAGDALQSIVLLSPWGEPSGGMQKRLIEQYGDPFLYDSDGGESVIADFNPHYWTAQLAFETLLIYEPHSNLFYSYLPDRGLWQWQTDPVVRNIISAYLLDYARRLNQPVLEENRRGERLAFMLTILRGLTERRDPFHKFSKVIHLRNGMLHLDCRPPELREFSPHYYSLNQCPVAFDEAADCPRFLRDLAYFAMEPEDATLFQLVGGMYLMGRNTWQKLLILMGIGGGGKGTLARIVAAMIGRENVKQLRTRLLDDRFEMDNLDQCSLLVGSDVDGDFLSCRGAKVIKALTGGDPLTMEAKGGRKRDVYGEHNILITCNDRLRVKLDGDESAWKRRLLIIDFTKAPPERPVEDFDRILIEQEGSGILNWFILGAAALVELSERRGKFPLTARQDDRVENLLAESDSLRRFARLRIERAPGQSATVEQIYSAYENFCAELGWCALAKNQAEKQLGPLMMEFHRAAKRNDIQSGGSGQKRGFMNIQLVADDENSTEETA